MKKFTVTPIKTSNGKTEYQVVDQDGIPADPPNTREIEADAITLALALNENEILLEEARQKAATGQPLEPGQQDTGPIIALSPNWILVSVGNGRYRLHPRRPMIDDRLKIDQKILIRHTGLEEVTRPSPSLGR